MSPLAGPSDLEDAVDAQREKVRLVSSMCQLAKLFNLPVVFSHLHHALMTHANCNCDVNAVFTPKLHAAGTRSNSFYLYCVK